MRKASIRPVSGLRGLAASSALRRTITGNIGSLRLGADDTGKAAANVLENAKGLAACTADITRQVESFLRAVKAA
jgi:methyl-accepting chemotaxis protein